jgi:hypothetical protein
MVSILGIILGIAMFAQSYINRKHREWIAELAEVVRLLNNQRKNDLEAQRKMFGVLDGKTKEEERTEADRENTVS